MFAYGIQPRRKGQRYAKPVMPAATFVVEGTSQLRRHTGEPVGTFEAVGSFEGTDGYGLPHTYEVLQVVLADGTAVAAYRRGPGFAVCQDFGYTLGKVVAQ